MKMKFQPVSWAGILLFSLFLVLSSCRKENMCDCFKSTGAEKTEIRDVTGFTKIELNDNVDLRITPGKDFSCRVTAGSKLVGMVTTEVEGNTLVIRNHNKCNWVRSFENRYTVDVSLPLLEYLYYSGSGDITSLDTIRCDRFIMDAWTCSGSIRLMLSCNTSWLTMHTGTGDLTASGSSGVSYVYNAGAGPADCSKLASGYTYITSKSTNDCYVNVTKEIGAGLFLQGNIFYSGNPYKIEKSEKGEGRLLSLP